MAALRTAPIITTWKEVRNEVHAANPKLATIIDNIDPSDQYKLIKSEYLYGDLIINNGTAQFFSEENDELLPLTHPLTNKKIQQQLFYSEMPLFLMLEKDNEVFIDTGSRIIPINLFHKGNLSGVYETMDFLMGVKSKPIWNFSAGSRSIVTLPKITNKIGLRKLHTMYQNISTIFQVKDLSEHWQLFKFIAQDKNFKQSWKASTLFFGEKWINNNYSSKEWLRFKHFLFQKIWEQAMYPMNKLKFNLYWEKFSEAISLRRLQPKPYLIDQVKHILSIVAGNFPAFKPLDNSQESAPVHGLQEALISHYGLKQYLPTLFHACMINDSSLIPSYLYYTLALPTVLEGSPLKKSSSTIINDIREIKLLVETLKRFLVDKSNEEVNKIIKNTDIEYFHNEKDICGDICLSKDIAQQDISFLKDAESFPNRSFCWSSPFFSGCIRIAAKTE